MLNTFAKAAHAPQMAIRIDKRLTDALPKGVGSLLLQLPALKGVRRTILADLGIPEEILGHVGFTAQFDTRDTERALAGSRHRGPAAGRLRRAHLGLLGAQARPRPLQGPLVRGRHQRAHGRHHRRLERHRPRGGDEDRGKAGGIPLLVARSMDKLEEAKAEIEAAGGTAYAYSADLSDLDSIDALVKQILDDHVSVDMLVNNAGRSIRRSIALSQDRFHDFERTMQLNYFGAIRLTMGLLPHMRERGSGHIVNVSSIGAQTNPPRFSAYVASKAALDAWTRVVSSEVVGDGITFTTIHMPLVRTRDDRADEDVRLVPHHHARRGRRPRVRGAARQAQADQHAPGDLRRGGLLAGPEGRRPGPAHGLQGLPGLGRGAGEKDPNEKASMEQVAMANLMKGVHW